MKISIEFPTFSTVFKVIIAVSLIVYTILFFRKKAYLREFFQSGGGSGPNMTIGSGQFINVGNTRMVTLGSSPKVGPMPAPRTQIMNEDKTAYNNSSNYDVKMSSVETPYTQEPIQELDDYEYNMVFMNESNTALSKDLRQKLMSQYPMHWTAYPPSSSQFQAGLQESFQNATQSVPDDAKPYQNISGSTMAPPDLSGMEREERKILQTYRPEFPPKMTTYDERDARKLIKKIYDAKGLIADVNHREGTNVYEIVGTRRKNETVQYEDEEAPASSGAVQAAGEGVVQAPYNVEDTTGSTKNPWKYTAWTPNLEKVFAPSDPRDDWT